MDSGGQGFNGLLAAIRLFEKFIVMLEGFVLLILLTGITKSVLETIDELENLGDLYFGVFNLCEFKVGFDRLEVCEFKYEGWEILVGRWVPFRLR